MFTCFFFKKASRKAPFRDDEIFIFSIRPKALDGRDVDWTSEWPSILEDSPISGELEAIQCLWKKVKEWYFYADFYVFLRILCILCIFYFIIWGCLNCL